MDGEDRKGRVASSLDARPDSRLTQRSDDRDVTWIAAGTGATAIVLIWLRWRLAYFPGMTVGQDIWAIRNAFYDIGLLAGVALTAAVLAHAFRRRRPGLAFGVVGVFFLYCILSIVAACVNISAISFLGGPLTYQWLYYADFLATFTSQSAIKSALNPSFHINLWGGLIGFAVLTGLALGLLSLAKRWMNPVILIGLGGLALIVFLLGSADRRGYTGEARAKTINPLMELVRTAATAGNARLEAEPNPITPARLPPAAPTRSELPVGLASGKLKNVVIIVMESVGADSVAGFGTPGAAVWTPNLARYAGNSLRFTQAYAHVPYSTKSMYALMTAQYPLFTFKLETDHFATTPLPTLSDLLHAKGYRTGFFMSGELAFQRVDRFLKRHSFDTMTDMSTLGCEGRRYVGSTLDWPDLDSVDDDCTADAVITWIDQAKQQPFLGVFWTGNTHWPYFSSPAAKPGQYAQEERRNRYIGALKSSDAAIGKVLDHLKKAGLLETTLVVVLGDHGEAFGQHGYRVHGNSIFEEEVHIPLMLIGGEMRGGVSSTLGGISDIAPTIAHVLGIQPPTVWGGRSLFATQRSEQVFMFSTNQEMTVGYRQGDRKFVYETARDRAMIFDERQTPPDTHDLARPGDRELVRRRIAGWLIAQDATNTGLAALKP